MKSELTVTANLIDELESIGFEVIPAGSMIKLSDEGKILEITNSFNEEIMKLKKSSIYNFDENLKDSAINLEALFINSFDFNAYV